MRCAGHVVPAPQQWSAFSEHHQGAKREEWGISHLDFTSLFVQLYNTKILPEKQKNYLRKKSDDKVNTEERFWLLFASFFAL